MKTRLTLIVLTTLALTACGESETKSVDYYKEHNEEREAKIKECDNNPGELAKTPNCINAKKAAQIASRDSRDMDFTGYFNRKQ